MMQTDNINWGQYHPASIIILNAELELLILAHLPEHLEKPGYDSKNCCIFKEELRKKNPNTFVFIS